MIKLAIGCDHAAYEEKQKIIEFLRKKDYQVIDLGTDSIKSVDYPKFAHSVAKMVASNAADKGILLCGSGIGISIAANKIRGIRAALCTSVEHAEMSRKHNDANILALGSRMTSEKDIFSIIDVWLSTEFEGGRHLDRINMIEYE